MNCWSNLIRCFIVSCDTTYIVFPARGWNYQYSHICPLPLVSVLHKILGTRCSFLLFNVLILITHGEKFAWKNGCMQWKSRVPSFTLKLECILHLWICAKLGVLNLSQNLTWHATWLVHIVRLVHTYVTFCKWMRGIFIVSDSFIHKKGFWVNMIGFLSWT